MEVLEIIKSLRPAEEAPTNRTDGDNGNARFTVAIIGAGFAGATLAAQLLRRAGASFSVVLIERRAFPGRGVAYGTQFDGHLLNVRAQSMSAYPETPDHFLRWAQKNYDCSVKAGDFLPRRVYGQYVLSLLHEERKLHPGQFQCIQDEAVSVARLGRTTEIRLRNGRTIFADKVVLALGNFPPANPHLPGKTPASVRYVSNPWLPSTSIDPAKYADKGDREKSVLLVGSGLTAVDVAIELRARGFEGTIHTLSRRGLLPQTHQAFVPVPLSWNKNFPRTTRGLLRLIRAEIHAATVQGGNWRAVIDSLRPVTQEIWRSLPRPEQQRFLRHVRPYWEVHRHRVAPSIGAQLASQLLSGQIQIHAGRITAYREDSDGVTVSYRDRKSGKLVQLLVDRVINCTGPDADLRRVDSLLLSNLISQKLACPDSLFLGLAVSENGALIDSTGTPSRFLYTVGSLRKGSLWETTAVPEIRAQVSELATLLSAEYVSKNLEPEKRESRQLEPVAAHQSSVEQVS
jgi:uncharacterized NAD(P)/FAD-binding protein YdhS